MQVNCLSEAVRSDGGDGVEVSGRSGGSLSEGGSSNGLHWAQLHTKDVHDPRAIAATFLTEWEHAGPLCAPLRYIRTLLHTDLRRARPEKRPSSRALEPPRFGFR